MLKIYPYKVGSESARKLAEALNVKRIKHEGNPVYAEKLLNWGASSIAREINFFSVFNSTWAVAKSLDAKYVVPKKILNKKEYRIHVFQDDAFLVQIKHNQKLKNEAIDMHWDAKEAAINVVFDLGLDFAAVDVVWDKDENKYYIAKVNTAPDLNNSVVLEKYVEQFRTFV